MLMFRGAMLASKLTEFILSGSDFRIVHNVKALGPEASASEKLFVEESTERICILDSSFNPPHLGHMQLARDSLAQVYRKDEKDENKVLLLLLSVKNADKINPQPASFRERLDMMCLMANHMYDTYNINVSVGLTKHAKFVDKSSCVRRYIKEKDLLLSKALDHLNLTFLVGFDTLIRIFNPKYYLPFKVSQALAEFMKTTDIFCLSRSDEDNSFSEQAKYVMDIEKGNHEDIPADWASRIFFELKDKDETSTISSSSVRKDAKINGQDWEKSVIPEIVTYIKEHTPYSDNRG